MNWLSLGSMALPSQLNRNSTMLRSEMTRLGTELTTGEVADKAKALRGNLSPLSAVETRLSRIAAYTQANTLASTAADVGQSVLNRIADAGSDVGARMMAVSNEGISPATLRAGATSARGALTDLSNALGQRVAGRAIFSGTVNDTSPLPSADDMIAAVLPTVSGLTNTDDIVAAVTSAFMDAGGLFETTLYQGGPAAQGAAIDTGTTAPALPTAADPALRRMMAGLVMAALSGDDSMPLTDDQRVELAQASGTALMGAAPGMAELQGSLGETQARLDETQIRLTGERDALNLAKNNLVGADPYEAAGMLEVVQTRLETLYAFTARTARLSLTEYL